MMDKMNVLFINGKRVIDNRKKMRYKNNLLVYKYL